MSALAFLTIGILSSCQDETTDPVVSSNSNNNFISNPLSSDYLPDNDSSYWIYELSKSDSNGFNTTILGYDTMWVSTKMLNGISYKYYQFEYFLYPNPGRFDFWYMKDTLGIFLNEKGKTMMDINAINSIVRKDTLVQCYYYNYKMLRQVQAVSVPNGVFTDVVNYETTFQFSPCPTPNGLPAQRVWDRMFARNVGLIYESYGLTNDPTVSIYERKLVSYHLSQ